MNDVMNFYSMNDKNNHWTSIIFAQSFSIQRRFLQETKPSRVRLSRLSPAAAQVQSGQKGQVRWVRRLNFL